MNLPGSFTVANEQSDRADNSYKDKLSVKRCRFQFLINVDFKLHIAIVDD